MRKGVALAALCAGLAAVTTSAAANPDGARIYRQQCAVCHQPDGAGTAGFIPPLKGTLGHFLRVDEGRRYLPLVVQHGLAGRIMVSGVPYNSNMPAFGRGLESAEQAAVLNYVLTELTPQSTPDDFEPYDAEAIEALTQDGVSGAQAVRELRRTLVERLKAEGLKR